MRTLKLSRPVYFLLSLLAAALLWLPSIALAATFHVRIMDEGFNPDNITITVGDTVTWTVKSSIAHTMQPGDDAGGTCAEDINHTFSGSGETFSHTFTVAKPCYYTCPLHGGGMNGVVNVKEKTDTTTTTVPAK